MQGKTVLVIDDDLAFSEMISEVLRSFGARVIVEHDGVSGLNQALTSKPDVLLVDVMMPGMSGVALLEKLRADAWGSGVPAILLSNLSDPAANGSLAGEGRLTKHLLKTDMTLDGIAEEIGKMLTEFS